VTSHPHGAPADGTVHTHVRDLPRLTSLRAFAAFAVAGYHLSQGVIYHFGFFSQGYAGVAFFFVLSGFVLTWSAAPNDTVRRFYRRRFARLYPNYLAAAVLAILLGEAAGARVLIPNLLMVQAWWTDSTVVFGVNGVSWSLSCEVFFYACFPLLLLLFRRASRVRIVVGVGLAYVAVCVAAGGVLAGQGIEGGLIAYSNPLVRSGEFVLGMVLAILLQHGWRPRVRVSFAVAAVVGSAVVSRVIDGPFPTPDLLLLPSFAALIVAAALADLHGAPGVLRSAALVRAGQVSFAFYLLHALVIQQVIKHLSAPVPVVVVAALAVAGLAAWALHEGVERPGQVLLGPSRRAASPPMGTVGR